MKKCVLAVLVGLLAASRDAGAQESHPELSRRIPHLEARLRSGRWEARYGLLVELTGRDAETKRALEALVGDPNASVANQALVRYVNGFLQVDRSLFRPAQYAPRRFPVADLPEEDAGRALVEHLLGRRAIARKPGSPRHDETPPLAVLDASRRDDPDLHASLTIVGVLGRPEDADALRPFLESSNAYVALGAARAALRLGGRERGVEALLRIAERDPARELHYVTEALRALRDAGHPGLDAIARRVVAALDGGPPVQPNWVSEFLLVAADLAGAEVWTPRPRGTPPGPK